MSEILRTLLGCVCTDIAVDDRWRPECRRRYSTAGGGRAPLDDRARICRPVCDFTHDARTWIVAGDSDRLARGRLLGRYRCHNRHIRADGISDFRPCACLEAIFRCALATGSRNGSETGRCRDDPGVCLCPDPNAGWGLAGAAARHCLDRRAYDDAGEPICGGLGGHGDFHFPACGRAGLIDRLSQIVGATKLFISLMFFSLVGWSSGYDIRPAAWLKADAG